jgi:DNA-binding YbaB/EbfC family protein
MGTGFAKKKKQAKMLQEQLMQMQEQMKSTSAEGSAGNGLVTLTLNGDHEMTDLKIKPDCVDPEDIEGLEDLIRAAYADALSKLKDNGGMPDMGALGAMGGMPDLSSLGF